MTNEFIFRAAQEGSLSEVKALVEQGEIDLDKRNLEGETVLTIAFAEGHYELCEFLISNGADTKVKSSDGSHLLHNAVVSGNLSCLNLALKYTDINCLDNEGYSALHLAVLAKEVAVCIELIRNRANVNIPDNDGWTPLHHACDIGHEQIIKILLDSRANPTIKNSKGNTAIDSAIIAGHGPLLGRINGDTDN